MDFNEAFEEFHDLISKYFMKIMKSKNELLHRSLIQKGLLIYVPENVEVKDNITLNYEFLTNSFDHLLIIVDKNSIVKVVEKLNGNEIYRNNMVEIYVKDNSKVDFYSIQNLNDKCNNFSLKKSFIGRDAECNIYNFDFGGLINYNEVSAELLDHGSRTNIYGTFYGNGKQQFNLGCNSIHKSDNSNSNILTKGILDDNCNVIYRGLIKIEDNAKNSNGYQKEETLILSDNAKADSIPDLEINNNEVTCSHGSSTGHLDKDKKFYLMSRGISEKKVDELIIEGFLLDVVKKSGDLKEEIIELIKGKIKC